MRILMQLMSFLGVEKANSLFWGVRLTPQECGRRDIAWDCIWEAGGTRDCATQAPMSIMHLTSANCIVFLNRTHMLKHLNVDFSYV